MVFRKIAVVRFLDVLFLRRLKQMNLPIFKLVIRPSTWEEGHGLPFRDQDAIDLP